LLPELALVINTTTTQALPQKRTPFEVWFGRKPHWITAKPIEDNETDPNDSETGTDSDLESDNNSDDNNNDNVLLEIEVRVAAHNARLNAQMIKANNGRSEKFMDGTVATLQIPLKLQLATESSRLPVRVLELKNGQYKLQCQYGRLTGRYQGGELNHIDATVGIKIGANIQNEPSQNQAGKDITITLPMAVAKQNNRGSITTAQKNGRKPRSGAKTGAKPGAKPHAEPSPKPSPKPGMKRKRAEVEDGSGKGEEPSPRRLRNRA
jgi:hypothetical protein